MVERAPKGLKVSALHAAIDDGSSERTIFRDLENLQAAGFPLYSDDGAWRMLPGDAGCFELTTSPTEVLALLLSEDLLDAMRGSDLVDALRSLRERASAMLAPTGRAYVEALRGSLVASFTAPTKSDRTPQVQALEEAIHKEQRVRIRYWTPRDGERTRHVDPYTLWFGDGRLYLIGWCHLREQVRTFSVDRIRAAEVLDVSFTPRDDFDAEAYVRDGFGGWNETPEKVILEFRQPVAHLARERQFHPTQRVTMIEDGSAMLAMEVGGLPRIASWIAGLGGLVIARKPRALVELVRSIHIDGIEAYDEMVTGKRDAAG